MLLFILIWCLIGTILTLVFCGKSMCEDFRRCNELTEIIGMITGMLVVILEAPILFLYGIIKGIFEILNGKTES